MIASTNDVYQAIIARVLNYVPTGSNPEMPSVALGSINGALGKRIWILQAPDAPAPKSPYVTLRLMARRVDPWHATEEAFDLELDVWARPRTTQLQQAVQQIADQIDAALLEWMEPTVGLRIYSERMRDTILYSQAPADRDVIREMMRYQGRLIPSFVQIEMGSS
jgi:hypothetical protein